jgi:hypothetical protein
MITITFKPPNASAASASVKRIYTRNQKNALLIGIMILSNYLLKLEKILAGDCERPLMGPT